MLGAGGFQVQLRRGFCEVTAFLTMGFWASGFTEYVCAWDTLAATRLSGTKLSELALIGWVPSIPRWPQYNIAIWLVFGLGKNGGFERKLCICVSTLEIMKGEQARPLPIASACPMLSLFLGWGCGREASASCERVHNHFDALPQYVEQNIANLPYQISRYFIFCHLWKGTLYHERQMFPSRKLKHEVKRFHCAMLLWDASPRSRLLGNSKGSDEAFKNKQTPSLPRNPI